jgi:15-cis-phytoene synthase
MRGVGPGLDPDRTLALSYMPPSRREAVRALWMLDEVLAAAALAGREPMLRRIKLAWWREALEKLDAAPPPAEPTLEALARHVLPLDLSGADLSALESGWAAVADDPSSADLHDYAAGRGGTLFAFTARLLTEHPEDVRRFGEGWALVDLVRRGGKADLAEAEKSLRPWSWPPKLRPLGMLAVLASQDARQGLEPPGSPGRMLRMLRHRLTGR